MLNAQTVHLKRQGKENVKHKPATEDEDLKKLKTSQAIVLTSPLTLLQNVWFHVVLFFCRRGREGQRELKRLELLSAAPLATLTPLSCSPNFRRAQYLDIRTLTHELIVK